MGDLESVVRWAVEHSGPGLYPVLVGAAFLENVFPPFPGDAFVVAGAFLSGRGALSVVLVSLSSWVGGMVGAMFLYSVGWRLGKEAVEHGWLRGLLGEKAHELESWFERRGVWLLLASRCIPAVRSGIALAAGVARYRVGLFALLTGVSFAIWQGALVLLGVTLGTNLEALAGFLIAYQRAMIVVIIVVGAAFVWRYVRMSKKRREV